MVNYPHLSIIFLFLIVTCFSSPKKIELKQKDDNYLIELEFHKKKISMGIELSNQKSWAKTSACKVCETSKKCEEDCLESGNIGIDCVSKYCKQGSAYEEPGNIRSGKQASVTFIVQETKQVIELEIVLADKLDENLQGTGRINLMQDNIFGADRLMLTKSKDKSSLQLFYGEQQTEKQVEIVGDALVINSIDEDPNIFEASQVKLLSQKDQSKGLSVPLVKINAELSLETNQLEFPKTIFKKLTSHLINQYFINGRCQINKQSELTCQQKISLSVLDDVFLQLTLNGVEIQIPFRAFFTTCTENKCSMLLGISEHKKNIRIGTFLFDIFAVQHLSNENIFNLYRLKNNWGQIFNNKSIKSHNFIVVMVLIVFKALGFIFKIIMYLGATILLLNMVYHWKDILRWIWELKDKFGEKKQKVKKLASGKMKEMRKKVRHISRYNAQIGSSDEEEEELEI